MDGKKSNWLHVSSFIIICWMRISLCWKLDNDNVLYTNRDITYNCALNTMCRCFPNETNLLQISCNEITLYKLPGELRRFLPFRPNAMNRNVGARDGKLQNFFNFDHILPLTNVMIISKDNKPQSPHPLQKYFTKYF